MHHAPCADDFCYGALYDIKVNGQSRSAVYNVYDVKGVSYTTAKFSGMRISYEEAEVSWDVRLR